MFVSSLTSLVTPTVVLASHSPQHRQAMLRGTLPSLASDQPTKVCVAWASRASTLCIRAIQERSKQLGQGYYLVEISTNQSSLYIAAFDVETDESLLIELP